MSFQTRIISKLDDRRLADELDRARESWTSYAPYLDRLRAELRGTTAVPAGDVPADVITMGSRFELSGRAPGEPVYYMLVYPEDAAPRTGMVSALSPMGAALLGARVGTEVCWPTADGPRAARVVRLLYQPEAAGHHAP